MCFPKAHSSTQMLFIIIIIPSKVITIGERRVYRVPDITHHSVHSFLLLRQTYKFILQPVHLYILLFIDMFKSGYFLFLCFKSIVVGLIVYQIKTTTCCLRTFMGCLFLWHVEYADHTTLGYLAWCTPPTITVMLAGSGPLLALC